MREPLRWLASRWGWADAYGLWIENTEGARFWMKVFNDLRNRGVADILIAVTDGLKGTSKSPFIRPPAADQARLVDMKAWGGR